MTSSGLATVLALLFATSTDAGPLRRIRDRVVPAPMLPAGPSTPVEDLGNYLAAINTVRAQHNLPTLVWSSARAGDADRGAKVAAARRDYAGHPVTTSHAEIMARGQRSIGEALNSWLASHGHRAILLGKYRAVGLVARLGVDGQTVWFAQFE